MKLQQHDQTAAPGAGAISVSLKENDKKLAEQAKSQKKEVEDFWEEISSELENGSSPAWRMWR